MNKDMGASTESAPPLIENYTESLQFWEIRLPWQPAAGKKKKRKGQNLSLSQERPGESLHTALHSYPEVRAAPDAH